VRGTRHSADVVSLRALRLSKPVTRSTACLPDGSYKYVPFGNLMGLVNPTSLRRRQAVVSTEFVYRRECRNQMVLQ
jgi:hypothetical protein